MPPTEARLCEACRLLDRQTGRIFRRSSVYRTESWGFKAPDFLNQIVALETELDPWSVLASVLRIEEQLGRTRLPVTDGQRYASRTIDIDILFYDHWIVNTPRLQIPHPRIVGRRFVLTGLQEIMPDYIHPTEKKRVLTLYNMCK